MWKRLVTGTVLCAVGAVWIAQGTNAIKGSMMSGHGTYTGLGIVVAVIGVLLLISGWRGNRARR